MKQAALFDMPADRRSRTARLHVFMKQHGILSHRAGFRTREQHPWIAILPVAADRGKDIGTIMSESCRLYDESNNLATGTGELSTVRTICEQMGILFDL